MLRENYLVVGIWDDHDYGLNDGDYKNPMKAEQK